MAKFLLFRKEAGISEMEVLNGLALCAGIGGMEFGLALALGDSYRTVCYVEREAYAAACLVKRMEEGFLDKAPVWDDVATFDGLPWRGLVDIVSSGFPCQPFSLAGKRMCEKDPRHLWPHIARIIGECEPSLVFLENVHISAFREPFDDLRAMGFTLAPPYICTAAEMGAGHIRRRVFVLGYAQHQGRVQPQGSEREERRRTGDAVEIPRNAPEQPERESWKEALPVSDCGQARREITGAAWWASEPGLERLVHGASNRVDRDRVLGNAVVPVVAAKAFIELLKETRDGKESLDESALGRKSSWPD